MRDPARIPVMCETLRRAWERSPDQRLGQLVVSAVAPESPCPEVFAAEDRRVRRALEQLARDGVPARELPPHEGVEIAWERVAPPSPSTVHLEGARVGTFEVGMHFAQILELRFGGTYRDGSAGAPDAAAMVEHVVTHLARCEPDVVLLDLSGLRYAWGDGILRVFEAIGRFNDDYPVDVVVLGGEASAGALASLGINVQRESADALQDAKTRALRRAVDIG